MVSLNTKQKNELNREIKRAEENYYKDSIDDSKANSNRLWKIIGELAKLKNNKKTFLTQIVTENEVIDVLENICEAFNVHFATVGKNIGKNIKSPESTQFLYPISPTRSFSLLLLLKRVSQLLVT